MNNLLYVAVGVAIGTALTFYQVDTPRSSDCGVYRVQQKVATAYVLKPPPAPEPEHVFCPTPIVQKPVEPVAAETESQKQIDETVEDNRHHRRRYRHTRRRHREYWR